MQAVTPYKAIKCSEPLVSPEPATFSFSTELFLPLNSLQKSLMNDDRTADAK